MTDDSVRAPTGNRSTGADGIVRARYEWASTSPSRAVIETVAVALDREPTGLESLYESVDPDALDALVRSTEQSDRGTVTVSFGYADRRVTVRGTGEVIVRPADPGR